MPVVDGRVAGAADEFALRAVAEDGERSRVGKQDDARIVHRVYRVGHAVHQRAEEFLLVGP